MSGYQKFRRKNKLLAASLIMSKSLVIMAASQSVTAIPREIDDHLKKFGKEPWEVDYGYMVIAICAIPG